MDTARLRIEYIHEQDGRWLADIPDLPGVMAYGATKEEAARQAQAIAFEILADMVKHGEELPEPVRLLFVA